MEKSRWGSREDAGREGRRAECGQGSPESGDWRFPGTPREALLPGQLRLPWKILPQLLVDRAIAHLRYLTGDITTSFCSCLQTAQNPPGRVLAIKVSELSSGFEVEASQTVGLMFCFGQKGDTSWRVSGSRGGPEVAWLVSS